MKDLSEILRRDEDRSRWYETERNTATLVTTVVSARGAKTIDGEDIWNLVRLCWITTGPLYRKKAKVPALASLFRKEIRTTTASARPSILLGFPNK
jgi:hypothetical protein